jgi:F-type H+-transporting ATPase subunit gamma
VRSPRDIRSKIRAVRSVEQICRAMKTVSSIRLRRAEQRLHRSRPYHQKLAELVSSLAALTQEHPFLQERPVSRTAVLLVTSDRGLCGGYNAAAARAALAVGAPAETVGIAVGRKGLALLRQHGYELVDQLAPLGAEPVLAELHALAERLGRRYLDREFDRLVLVYTQFLGGARTRVKAETALPVQPLPSAPVDIIFEPEPAAMLPNLMRRYLQNEILAAVLESAASEHAARVAAMTAATDNADEMIQRLTLDYNKARQATITKELIEIVSAADSAA